MGISERIIGDILGHTDPNATRIYARLSDRAPREALERYAEAVSGSRSEEGEDDE